MMITAKLYFSCIVLLAAVQPVAPPQAIERTPVIAKPVSRTVDLPGEFQPFLSVVLHPKVAGYVETVLVDRGSVVKEGQLLAELSAPEMKAQISEAESKLHLAEADRVQAQAQLDASESTLDRLQQAARTPGAIAGNELVQAEKQTDAAKALLEAREHAVQAAQASLDAVTTMESYLKVTAPFDGIVMTRSVHPGALAGPESALLELQQVARLRLVVSVPEEDVAGIVRGATVSFTVPAYPGRTFSGVVARIPPSLESKTRTLPVELDVANKTHALSPGMYAAVRWPVRGPGNALFAPKTSIVTTTERTFVIRDKGGRAEWVNVQKGPPEGDLLQVIGPLRAGDMLVKRGSDEIRDGATLGVEVGR